MVDHRVNAVVCGCDGVGLICVSLGFFVLLVVVGTDGTSFRSLERPRGRRVCAVGAWGQRQCDG